MRFLESVFSGINNAKREQREDSQYERLEDTPFLYSSEELRELSKSANKDQKASIYRHMVDFDVHDDEELTGYYDLSRDLWDDFSK
ncbi:hypothetical protein [Gracilibacillus sp. YIM 98692]|uniref:hypothetical protein n=1 Tax=Gracilibacillus sp. YIM 98692 TaxID=2663532 RepID=UPI0013D61695|nr:hypothetical protein [Gracilibacillus sp. YIM 98692]